MVERRTFCKGVALSLLAGATKPTFASLFHAENEFDVIVVGAGGAGLAAALTAAEAKARVLLIEKMGPSVATRFVRVGYLMRQTLSVKRALVLRILLNGTLSR